MAVSPLIAPISESSEIPDLTQKIASVLSKIPPLWTLKNFVAVNPFLGLQDKNFLEAADWIQATGHSTIFMEPEYYLEQFQKMKVSDGDYWEARNRILNSSLIDPEDWGPIGHLEALLDFLKQNVTDQNLRTKDPSVSSQNVFSFADWVDQNYNTQWISLIKDEISKWCSVYFDEGQSLWPLPWKSLSLWEAWKKACYLDKNPRFLGLDFFEDLIRSIPDEPLAAISWVLEKLAIPESYQTLFLEREIMSIAGWAGYIQYLAREKGQVAQKDETLLDFLAIRVLYDAAVFLQFSGKKDLMGKWQTDLSCSIMVEKRLGTKTLALYLSQTLIEKKYQESLIQSLKNQTIPAGKNLLPKTLQAVFCIDVRSEVYRRALESESEEIETLGFAGFFGLALRYFPFAKDLGTSLCPVLLQPRIQVNERLKEENRSQEIRLLKWHNFREILQEALNSFKTSAISCFSFVESVGLGFMAPLIGKSFPRIPDNSKSGNNSPYTLRDLYPDMELRVQADLTQRIDMATGALKNMGLTRDFARLVLICGHGSHSVNNPYASSLDCGACGGNSGEINAKVLAEVLNQSDVRKGLKLVGIDIPDETYFISGLHNTTTDEVEIFGSGNFPDSHSELALKVKNWLREASRKTRMKRLENTGFREINRIQMDQPLHDTVFRKSVDWSQIRPEWGLAGNASFIAAPRGRTQNIDLKGRTFLHNYQADEDPENSILELIMVAPVIVATWINLQYYGSTVNNVLYGSGNKVLHNMVGKIGVWQGNGGDLQSGLPLQSLHDGEKWIHEPLRLSVFLEAGKMAIGGVIQKNEELKNLVLHQWIYIFSIEPGTKNIFRYAENSQWEEV